MKKPFIFLLIVLMVSLFLNHLLKKKIRENFNSEGSQQNNLVYQNAGQIRQQEKTITDFQTAMDNEIKDLSDRVTAFKKKIRTNATDISNNTVAIHSTTTQIKSSAKAKEAKMDKASGDMST